MRFKVGDRVIVRSFSKIPGAWNSFGGMNHWMGKVVTIKEILDKHSIRIQEDREENIGEGWLWSESDFLPIPKAGDKVKIRTWEDMKKQYGTVKDRDSLQVAPGYCVSVNMKPYCGEIVAVYEVEDSAVKVIKERETYFAFSTIEEVLEKKMEFTKDMLKNGEHIVEYRNGKRRLYLNGCFVGLDGGSPIEGFSNDLKDIELSNGKFDVMAVYRAEDLYTFNSILTYPGKLIWEREEHDTTLSENIEKLKSEVNKIKTELNFIPVVLDGGAQMPTKAHMDDAGFDLYAISEQVIHPGNSAVFDTGVHMAIPEGYAGEVVGRSGLNINYDIICPKGTIDAGYTGNIKVKLYNLGKYNYTVHKGDKIAQLIIVPICRKELGEVDVLPETDRGDTGFGASGR